MEKVTKDELDQRQAESNRPSAGQFKADLLNLAETSWGWNRGQIRKLRRDYTLLFDFVQAGRWSDAEDEVEDAEQAGDLTASERDDVLTILQGEQQ